MRHRQTAPCRVLTALLLLLVIVPAACSSLPSPSSNMATGEALNDLSTVISQLREENAQMQAQIDSLGSAVAYQDSVLRQLAVTLGVPMRPQGRAVP